MIYIYIYIYTVNCVSVIANKSVFNKRLLLSTFINNEIVRLELHVQAYSFRENLVTVMKLY